MVVYDIEGKKDIIFTPLYIFFFFFFFLENKEE